MGRLIKRSNSNSFCTESKKTEADEGSREGMPQGLAAERRAFASVSCGGEHTLLVDQAGDLVSTGACG